MLNYSEFEPFQTGTRQTFKFKKLRPIDEGRGIYADSTNNRRYHVSLFTNKNQVQVISELVKIGAWGNIKGLFKKKNTYYVISELDCFQTLGEYLQEYKGHRDQITEVFCLQLIESIVEIATQCDQLGYGLKILNPFYLIVLAKDGKFTFKLKYPYCHDIFEALNSNVVNREAEFCAPQILVLMNRQYELANKPFSKAVIYSLGLVLLYCFGYRIKSEERILALKNNKEFTMFLKAIRKQIKVFHQGKFISKLIKILLEQSQEVRDNLQTFAIKLTSPHLQSLRKFVFMPQPIKDSYIPTIYSDHSEIVKKSRLNRTIEIQGSSNTSNNKTLNSSRQNNTELHSIYTFQSFKKSNDKIEQYSQQNKQDVSVGQLSSPIDIKIDWDQQEDLPYSTRRSMTAVKKRINDGQNEKSEQISMNVNGVSKQKCSYSQGKNRNRASRVSKISRISQRQKIDQQIQHQDQTHIDQQNNQMKIKIQNHQQSLVNLSEKFNKKSEEQPQIIKYENLNSEAIHRPLKKKISNKQNVELQDMNLMEDQEQEEQAEDVESPISKYEQMSMELSKKSEAVFIILLISFLIYKMIDYVIA